MTRALRRQARGLTLLEILTAVVAVVVVVAVAIPLWRTHQLRERRADAMAGLLAVQSAQDQHFARYASYADESLARLDPPHGLGLKPASPRLHYRIRIERSEDQLGYVAIASAVGQGTEADPRCAEMRLDQHGRRSAVDGDGKDTSANCWNTL